MHPQAKRWLRTIVAGTVLGLAGVVAGNLLFPAAAPALIEDLPADFAAASRQLSERARTRFPAGTPESALRAELAAQGFEINPERRTANWQRAGFRCTDVARIWWRAAQGRIVAVEGVRNAVCP